MAELDRRRHQLLSWIACLPIAALAGLGACQHEVKPTVNTESVNLDPPDQGTKDTTGASMSFIGIDGDGCEMFRPVAKEGELVIAAIYYRTENGELILNKDQAFCAIGIEPAGSDDEGCEIFRAIWPDSESLDRPLYRSGGDYTIAKSKVGC